MPSDRDIPSIYAHGISAPPGIAGYVQQLANLDSATPEFEGMAAASLV